MKRVIAGSAVAAIAVAGLLATAGPAAAQPVHPAWGKTQEGKHTNISADFTNDWAYTTYVTASLNPRLESARNGYMRLMGPNNTLIAKSGTKTWNPGENYRWQGKASIGKNNLLCLDFINGDGSSYERTCITAS